VNRLKQLYPGALIGIILGGVLLFGLAGWFLLVHPQSSKLKSLKEQTAEVQAKLDAYQQQVAAARAAPKIEVADIYRLAKAMPDRTDMPDLLLELDQTAQSAGVKLQSIQPSAPAEGASGYSTVHITLSADGNFYTLTDLLYRLRTLVYVRSGSLEANGRIFSIDTVNLSPTSGTQMLATITLDTYVYGALLTSGGTSLTATSTTPAATGTTTTSSASSGPTAAGATP